MEREKDDLNSHILFTDPNVRRLLIRELDEMKTRRERAENHALLLLGACMVCMIGVVVCFVVWMFF